MKHTKQLSYSKNLSWEQCYKRKQKYFNEEFFHQSMQSIQNSQSQTKLKGKWRSWKMSVIRQGVKIVIIYIDLMY